MNIDSVIDRVRYFVENFDQLLAKQIDPVKKSQFFGLIFSTLPTYNDLVRRNQNSPLFTGVNPLFQALATKNFPVVTLPLSVYKKIVSEIIRWNEVLRGISFGGDSLQLA